MNFIRRFFKTGENTGNTWVMFRSSKSEIREFLVSLGQLSFADDSLTIKNYPFEPSIAYRQNTFPSEQIDDIDFTSSPPTCRIGNELLFLSAEQKTELKKFAGRNNIKTVKRPMIWEWILEPFLDTEFTAETDQKLTQILAKFGLTAEQVQNLRAEVETQMLKYNFDTMLWEWCGFDASDVLRAMRTKYQKAEFEDFYQRVMEIALLTEKE
ncbi:DUF7079 family protein [Chryseobacterium arthrosphaerae]|uniref:DUF7079 family protein n=1 Tax=Chryseobacterium arthrosphaerae TaxID=651561 RepID=UPI002016A4AA|nr:hypothetical protein [Chryseobacterium arthrosphaerae]